MANRQIHYLIRESTTGLDVSIMNAVSVKTQLKEFLLDQRKRGTGGSGYWIGGTGGFEFLVRGLHGRQIYARIVCHAAINLHELSELWELFMGSELIFHSKFFTREAELQVLGVVQFSELYLFYLFIAWIFLLYVPQSYLDDFFNEMSKYLIFCGVMSYIIRSIDHRYYYVCRYQVYIYNV